MLFDVFNGDADGICALQQLRLAEPAEARLVTGVKRDIQLLEKVSATEADQVTVLDISLDKNHADLIRILEAGARVRYFDHHQASEIPNHPNLITYIDTSPEVCTSLLVNHYLHGQHLAWAVTGAFGDNLYDSARAAAEPLGLSGEELEALRELGTCLNYNGYGASVEDLYFPPDRLYHLLRPYTEPLEFIASEPAYRVLRQGYADDLKRAQELEADIDEDRIALYILPDAKWARRISGILANQLARQNPDRAHALLTKRVDDAFVVSVRAPLNNKSGADRLCSRFPGGGGRQGAAGINRLASKDVENFIVAFRASYNNA